MSDAPVTRPDLEGFVYCPAHGDLLSGVRSWRCANAPKGHEFAALAAERARADQSNAALLDDAADAIEARYYEQDAAVEYLRSRSRGLTAEQR